MCGIFAYLGSQRAISICIDGLRKLEYRGYDSSGIAGILNHELVICKKLGNVSYLEEALRQKDLEFSMAISHIRWATHGKPSAENAHPHLDEKKTVAVVHNGVIDNYASLKAALIQKAHVHFSTQTDSEVIAHQVAYEYDGNLFEAAQKTFAVLEGSFAVALIHKDHPEQMVVAAEKSPLVIGFCKESSESFVASDANALSGRELDLYYLVDGQIAVLEEGKDPEFFDRYGASLTLTPKHEKIEESPISKDDFDHFMLKEIYEQQTTVKDAMVNYIDETTQTTVFDNLPFSKEELKSFEHVLLLGCGSSYNAACIGAFYFEEIAKLSVRSEIASEFRYKDSVILPRTLILAISQSGETADTIAAVRKLKGEGHSIIALSNSSDSSLTRLCDGSLLLQAGTEIAVSSTKTFTSQITLFYLLALYIAQCKGLAQEKEQVLIKHLYDLPDLIVEILNDTEHLQDIAKKHAHHEHFFFLGRDVLFPVALQGALLLKEVAYINATGYAAGEMRHGPMTLLGKNVPVVILYAQRLKQKMVGHILESKARGASVLVFSAKDEEEGISKETDDLFWIPLTSAFLEPILMVIVCQLFAYFIANERGTDIDYPRHLAKSVTVD